MPIPVISDLVKRVESVTLDDFNPKYLFSKKDGESKSLDERFKIRMEKMKAFNQKGMDRLQNVFAAPIEMIADFMPPHYHKTKEELEFINDALGDSFLFAHLAKKERRVLIDAFERFKVNEGHAIMKQGDIGDYFYIIHTGTVQFFVDGANVGEADPGESFGELALMYDTPRAATVLAIENCNLFRVGQKTFRRILMSFDLKKDDELKVMLKKIAFFEDLDNRALAKIASAMTYVSMPQGKMLEITKETVTKFYIIQKGRIEVSEISLNGQAYPDTVFVSGDHFGANQLISNDEMSCIFHAVQDTTLLEMSKEHFLKVIGDPIRLAEIAMDRKKLRSFVLADDKKLTAPEAEILSRLIVNKVYPKGHQFFVEGNASKARLLLVRSGNIQIETSHVTLGLQYLAGVEPQGGGPRIIGKHGYFGDDTICFSNKREALVSPMYTATALEDCEVGVLTLHTILAVVAKVRGQDVKLEDLKRHKLLGSGSFGKVYLVTNKDSKEAYALKSQNKKQLIKSNQADGVVREREVMGMLDYPFIIKLVTSFQDPLHVYMLTSLYLGGELRSIMNSSRYSYLPEWVAKFYAANVLDGLGHMHRRRILYRDLKPENVLLDSDGYTVIVDLGFAKFVPGKTYTFCGTPLYLAPEIILQRGHDEGADHWSWAVMLYEMIVGIVPFWEDGMDQRALMKAIVNGAFEFPAGDFMSEESMDLLRRMLVVQPHLRLGCHAVGDKDIRNHEFFDSIDWEALAKREVETPVKPHIKDPLDSTNFRRYREEKEVDDGVPLTKAEQAIFKDF